MWIRIGLAAVLCALCVCVALALVTLAEGPADWRPAAPALAPRFEGPGAVVEGKFYVFGGFNDGGFGDGGLRAIRHVEVYDPARDHWTRLGEAPTGLTHIMPAAEGPYVWIAGGFLGNHPGEAVATVWRYDTRDDSWSEGPPLPRPLGGGGLVRVGRALHYFGGYLAAEQPEGSTDHWALDLDDEAAGWRARAPLPQPRGHHGAVALEGRIYAFGGTHVHHPIPEDISSNVRYDPAADRWEPMAPLPAPRSHIEPGTVVVGRRILLIGGRDNASGHLSETAMADMLTYEPDADAFRPLPLLPRPLRGPAAFLAGNELVVTMGSVHGANHPQAATWRIPCTPDGDSACNPDAAPARVRFAAAARNLLKRGARVTPWPVGAIWRPLRSVAIPYWRDPPLG